MSQVTKSSPVLLSWWIGSPFRFHILIAKVPLCLLVAFSAFFGYSLAPIQSFEPGLLVFFGVLFLATGSASLNSLQERRVDQLMGRTRNRPLARRQLSRRSALLQAQLLLGIGFFILYGIGSSVVPLLVGGVSVLLYNFIYTPLKHRTIWALLPGALCGALPPYIGWLGGGGYYLAPQIIGVLALFIVWQIPHFWLIVLDNQRDYRLSGIPSLIRLIPERSLQRISIVWVLSLVTIIQIISVLLIDMTSVGRIFISFISFVFFFYYACQFLRKPAPSYRFMFIVLNIFVFLVMVILSVESIGNLM